MGVGEVARGSPLATPTGTPPGPNGGTLCSCTEANLGGDGVLLGLPGEHSLTDWCVVDPHAYTHNLILKNTPVCTLQFHTHTQAYMHTQTASNIYTLHIYSHTLPLVSQKYRYVLWFL